MRVSIRTRQVLGVTAIVAAAVVVLTGWYLLSLADMLLAQSQARAELIANTIYQRATAVVASGEDPVGGLSADGGLQAILQGSHYSGDIAYAAIVDERGTIVAHDDASFVGLTLAPATSLDEVLARGSIDRLRLIYTEFGLMVEVRQGLLLSGRPFGSIRVGFSTLLIRSEFEEALRTPVVTAIVALAAAVLVSLVLARVVVRPIHVIGSRLARLGRGELEGLEELPSETEFGDLGESFKAVAHRIAADRTELAGRRATLESVARQLESGVALFDSAGALLFANPTLRPVMGGDGESIRARLAESHPYRQAVERALAGAAATEPTTVELPDGGERQILTQVVTDADNRPIGVMLVSRDLAYLGKVESTLSYSRKLAALSRLSAGIAHEIKNPLNAVMIHLELLRMRLTDAPGVAEHLSVIEAQIRRLDEVVQGFLKFTRPEDLRLQPVALTGLFETLVPVLEAEAGKFGVDVRVECPAGLAPVAADRSMLEQAFLNLGLNACQAMPNGGRLRITAREHSPREVEVLFEDTGVGIAPEHLPRIFDLYFTTRERGSGIGLSLVYRTIQLHDGEIEVQSTPGRGTTFRVLLRRAEVPATTLPIAAS